MPLRDQRQAVDDFGHRCVGDVDRRTGSAAVVDGVVCLGHDASDDRCVGDECVFLVETRDVALRDRARAVDVEVERAGGGIFRRRVDGRRIRGQQVDRRERIEERARLLLPAIKSVVFGAAVVADAGDGIAIELEPGDGIFDARCLHRFERRQLQFLRPRDDGAACVVDR